MDMLNDNVFRQMEYHHRWVKDEFINIWGKRIKIKIVAKAYKKKPITDAQRESYKFFKSNLAQISQKTEELICSYVKDNYKEIQTYWSNAKIYNAAKDFGDDLLIKTAMFEQDGTIVLLCDVAWDIENGLGIKIFPEYVIGLQDLFL